MTLNIKTSEYEMLEGGQPLALIYIIYYICIQMNLYVHALVKNPKDQTLLIQSHTNDANIRVPKSILWKDVALPSKWVLKNEHLTRHALSDIANLDMIQQYLDGLVRISFDESWGFQPLKIKETGSKLSEKSTSSIPPSLNESIRRDLNLKLKGVQDSS